MTTALETLTVLRRDVANLLAQLDANVPPGSPARLRTQRDGTRLRYWHDSALLAVHVAVGYPGAVFLSAGREIGLDGDWSGLSAAEARELGLALLAAAVDAESEVTHAAASREQNGT